MGSLTVRQSHHTGMVLIICLIMVGVMGTVGFATVQQSNLIVLMARNEIDLALARLSAQQTLARELAGLGALPVVEFTPRGNAGLYRVQAIGEQLLWQQPSSWRSGQCRPAARRLLASAAPGCAIIELLRFRADDNYRAFRVTVRGVGSKTNTVVLLQAHAVLKD